MEHLQRIKFNNKGVSLVEILLAMALFTAFLPAVISGLTASSEGLPEQEKRDSAQQLVNDTYEIVRTIRENSWANLSNGTYRPVVSGNTWVLQSGTETTADYSRWITVGSVNRDVSGNIVTTGGTTDPSTKSIKVSVSWTSPNYGLVTSDAYVTRFLQNANNSTTTQAAFDLGSYINTESQNSSGGEVVLTTAASGGSWASPVIVDTLDHTSNGNGLEVHVDGNYAYLGTQHSNTETDFSIVDISNPANVSQVGGINIGANINMIATSGNYAYLASSGDPEFSVVDITNKTAPSQVASLNLSGNPDGLSIYVSGNYAYLGRANGGGAGQNEFSIINITNPLVPSVVGTANMNVNVNDIEVVGNYAYLATASAAQDLMIYNVTNKLSPALAGSYNTTATPSGLFINGNRLYLATAVAAGASPEFYILNITSSTTPSLVGSFNVGTLTRDVVVSGTHAVLTGDSGNDMVVLDLATESAPTLLTSVNLDSMPGTALRLAISGNNIYFSHSNNPTEMFAVQVGGGTAYNLTGTYESASFDALSTVAFNYIDFVLSEPASTNINFQIATNTNNTTWNYVGPDGTSGTYYESAGEIPLTVVQGRYFRFRAYFTSDGANTPELQSFNVNYSP